MLSMLSREISKTGLADAPGQTMWRGESSDRMHAVASPRTTFHADLLIEGLYSITIMEAVPKAVYYILIIILRAV